MILADLAQWNDYLNDGQILTYIQSYDNADDSISYYYSLMTNLLV